MSAPWLPWALWAVSGRCEQYGVYVPCSPRAVPPQKLSCSMQADEGTDWLLELLTEVQLQQYFLRIRDDLNVTRLSHFEYVKNEDLEKIGMGRPGAYGHGPDPALLALSPSLLSPITLLGVLPRLLGPGKLQLAAHRAWYARPMLP